MSIDRAGDGPPTGRAGSADEISFGGVAVRGEDVLVITPAGRRRITALPKGGAQRDESGAEAAGREVREETGVNVEVREPLGEVSYTYRRAGRRIRKTVHFYLCEFVSGSTDDHDHEVEDARWIPMREARTALTYPGERELIERALSKLRPGR